MSMIKATFFAILEPRFPIIASASNRRNGFTMPTAARAIRLTKNMPASLDNGAIAVRVVLELPDYAFAPAEATAIVSAARLAASATAEAMPGIDDLSDAEADSELDHGGPF